MEVGIRCRGATCSSEYDEVEKSGHIYIYFFLSSTISKPTNPDMTFSWPKCFIGIQIPCVL